jgi:hypothetical protein
MAQVTTRSDEFASILELMAATNSRLNELARLEPDWDSYGAKPISGVAISLANRLLLDVARRSLELGHEPATRMRPWYIAPLADGGLQIEWRSDAGAIEVEIAGDGRFGYLVERNDGQFDDSGPLTDDDWNALIDIVIRQLT